MNKKILKSILTYYCIIGFYLGISLFAINFNIALKLYYHFVDLNHSNELVFLLSLISNAIYNTCLYSFFWPIYFCYFIWNSNNLAENLKFNFIRTLLNSVHNI